VKPLLVVDGDSLAHRAYHGLPKTIRRAGGGPSGAIVGFTNMLTRLYDSEQPRAVLVGWDTLEVPTYRHEAFGPYQSGRVFDPELLEQLNMLPELVRAFGFAAAKAPGYEADDFLAAAVVAKRRWKGPVLVVTSDRDAFQLASGRVTLLMPTRGVSELARVGPAEVRERYDVEPEQVPDFIALRGDPSDKLPGAPGVGPKGATPESPVSTRTLSIEMPKVSAAIIARPVDEPLTSTVPTCTVRVPSGSTLHPADDGVRAPPHEPRAMPTPSPSSHVAVYIGCCRAASRHSTMAMRGHGLSSAPGSPSRDAFRRRSSIGSIFSSRASSSSADSSAK